MHGHLIRAVDVDDAVVVVVSCCSRLVALGLHNFYIILTALSSLGEVTACIVVVGCDGSSTWRFTSLWLSLPPSAS